MAGLKSILATLSKSPDRPSVIASVEEEMMRRAAMPRNDPDWGHLDVWHPSDICKGICPRQRVILDTLPSTPGRSWTPSAGLQRVFDVGHQLHKFYQNQVLGPAGILYGQWSERLDELGNAAPPYKEGFQPSAGWFYKEPALLWPEYNIAGHCDGLVLLEGTWVLLDIKTTNSRAFHARKRATAWHVNQVQIYMHCTPQLDKEISCELGCVFYANKDSQLEQEYFFDKDRGSIAHILDDIGKVASFIELAALPTRMDLCSKLDRPTPRACSESEACFRYGAGCAAITAMKEDADG